MRRYESYKDSGVEWLGEVPSQWELTIGMNVFRENKRDNKGMKEKTVLSLSYGQIIIKPEEKLVGLVPESFETYQIVEPNDIIIRCTDLQNDQTSLRTGLAKDKGIITSAYLNLKVINNHSAKFLHYYLHTLDITKVLYKFGSGLRQNLSFLDFKRLPIIDIPLSEQQKISQFLDDKTAKIDQAVDLAEKQIALLKEHKQILIQNAVTRGLNPDVPLKDSGVEWIGQVPEHWEILSIKRLSQVKRGASPRPIDNPKYFDNDGEYAWVRISDVTASNMYLLETTQKLSNLGKSYSVPLMPGSLFLSIAGSVGKPIITKIKVCIHDGFVYFPEYKQNTKFLYYIFYSEQPYIGLGKMGTQLNLNTDTVGAIKIPIPPLCEQQKIADYLDTQTAKIDQAIALKTAHIEKLKEYKSVLINDVVTGKVQV